MNPTETDVVDTFYFNYSQSLSNVLESLINDMKEKGVPILNATNPETTHDFLQLILYNIDLNEMYNKSMNNNNKI